MFVKMLFFAHWMNLTFMLLAICAIQTATKGTRKASVEESTEHPQSAQANISSSRVKNFAQKAIIAIEIVNANDNSTHKSRGHKRTIESALGYGYSNNIGGYESFFNVKPKPPKYEVYKYSQHDIPVYEGLPKGRFQGYESGFQVAHPHGAQSQVAQHFHSHQNYQGQPHSGNFEVQKSIEYNLGRGQATDKNLQQFYQNGATLFSSLDQKGHLSSLSVQAPRAHGPRVPVIIFRVYTNQLTQAGGLHPNIPSSHPYANLNNVDLQGLLAGYVRQQQQVQGSRPYHAAHYSQIPQSDAYYPHLPVVGHQQYGPPNGRITGLDTNENYPDDAHTKVIFHKNKVNEIKAVDHRVRPQQGYNNLHANQEDSYYKQPMPQKFKITIPEDTYSKVEIQEHTYGPSAPASYTRYEQNQYDTPQQYEHHQQYYQAPSAHQDYQQSVQYQQVQHSPSVIEQNDEQAVQYDPKEYVQVAYDQHGQQQQQQQQQSQGILPQEYYQQNTYHQHEVQQQQQQQQPQEQQYQQYETDSSQDIEFLQRSPEQGRENPDYTVVKDSNDAGRDLHPKVFNYHAHGQRSSQKRKRERKSKAPSVVPGPKGTETLKTSQ